jgi:hypothetical protein
LAEIRLQLQKSKQAQMNWAMEISVLGCLLWLGALVLLIRRLGFGTRDLPVTAEWIDELSIERYRPMARLLDSGDLEFLRSQPGFTRSVLRKVRRQRCKIFRGYLRCLQYDFGSVCAAIKLVMVQSDEDRLQLAVALMRHRLMFAAGMAAMYCRLVFFRWGVCGVDVAARVKRFDRMRSELRTLVPAAVSTGA